ncbi:F-box protein PP2-B11-like [Nymphaea colorata]|nr:F-box protein PP2-B11-like [Nymphaea colorata]
MAETIVKSVKSILVYGSDNPSNWRMTPLHNSRFPVQAELLRIWGLSLQGGLDTSTLLHKDTTYSVVYVLKHKDPVHGLEAPAELAVLEKDGILISKRQINLNAGSPDLIRLDNEDWLGVEAGRFRPSCINGDYITFRLVGRSPTWKSGLVFAGVEIRPVHPQKWLTSPSENGFSGAHGVQLSPPPNEMCYGDGI